MTLGTIFATLYLIVLKLLQIKCRNFVFIKEKCKGLKLTLLKERRKEEANFSPYVWICTLRAFRVLQGEVLSKK